MSQKPESGEGLPESSPDIAASVNGLSIHNELSPDHGRPDESPTAGRDATLPQHASFASPDTHTSSVNGDTSAVASAAESTDTSVVSADASAVTGQSTPKRALPPPHLSEFYSLVAGLNSDRRGPGRGGHSRTDSADTTASVVGVFRRPSTTSSLNTSFSQIGPQMASLHHDLPEIVTSKEIEATIQNYGDALDAAEEYRLALLHTSRAAASFGAALEKCSKSKGVGVSSEGLSAAGGLHYLVSNHQQILAQSIAHSFERPVEQQLQVLRATATKNEAQFKDQLRAKSRDLRAVEKLNHKLANRRLRNLAEYRSSLQEITARVDDIDRLKYDYFQSAFNLAQNTSAKILDQARAVVRAELEISETIARKGWSGGGLDELIADCPDPFAFDGNDDNDAASSHGNDNDDTKHSEDRDSSGSGSRSSVSPDDFGSDDGLATIRGKPSPDPTMGGTAGLFDVNDTRPRKQKELFSVLQPNRSILAKDKDKLTAPHGELFDPLITRSESVSTITGPP